MIIVLKILALFISILVVMPIVFFLLIKSFGKIFSTNTKNSWVLKK